jgi:hypothetical protein
VSLEKALVAHLKAHDGLSALVDTRIYPLVIPQDGVLPCVTYQRISTPRQYTIGGTATVASPRIQVDCWGESYASAKDVAAQVLAALNHESGQIGSCAQAFDILVSLADNEEDSYESDTGRYRVRIDFRVTYEE